MSRLALALSLRLLRVISLVFLAALGSGILIRCSPGYFTEAREMDAAYAEGARTQLSAQRTTEGSVPTLLSSQLHSWMRGDLGRSRHYDVPVIDLLRERARTSARLLLQATLTGWALAATCALLLSARRTHRGELLIAGWTAALLALPVGVLATISLLLNKAGPVSVLAALIAVRDFKLLYRMLRISWRAPYVLYARAQGLSVAQITRVHLLPVMSRELLALAVTSFVVALSSVVPIEVIFDVPGLGQLAWTAAMNRDLPVLVAVTGCLAGAVGLASLLGTPDHTAELA